MECWWSIYKQLCLTAIIFLTKAICTVKYILRQVFILCMPHVNANLPHFMLDSFARLYTTWPEFHWWSLSFISVVWCKPNTLLSAYSSSLLQVRVSVIVLCTAKIIHHLPDCNTLPFSQCYYDFFWLLIPQTIRGSNPVGGEIFCTISERPQGLPTLLYNWNWVSFLEIKWTECGAHHLPLLGAQCSIGRAIRVPPLCACLACYRTAFTFIYNH